LFIAALERLGPDGTPDTGYRGRELARNSAIGKLALASGLRRQEFSYLLVYEIPQLPPPGRLPVPFPVPVPVPASVTKGRKYRTTWTDHASLEAAHQYAALDRAAAAGGSPWLPPPQWGEPLMVGEADAAGGASTAGGSAGTSSALGSADAWWRPAAGRACWRSAPAAGRLRRGRACSPLWLTLGFVTCKFCLTGGKSG
jgi:hypothetical protein